jgi:hypothetical protein
MSVDGVSRVRRAVPTVRTSCRPRARLGQSPSVRLAGRVMPTSHEGCRSRPARRRHTRKSSDSGTRHRGGDASSRHGREHKGRPADGRTAEAVGRRRRGRGAPRSRRPDGAGGGGRRARARSPGFGPPARPARPGKHEWAAAHCRWQLPGVADRELVEGGVASVGGLADPARWTSAPCGVSRFRQGRLCDLGHQ